MSDPPAVSLRDIQSAAERLRGRAVRTPLLRNDALDALTGARLLLKPEPLQRTGSFKFRGAWNTVSQLDPGRPVVAWSSGNHAQGVALAAKLHGSPATIVMPADAPAAKLEATRGYGANVVTFDRWKEDRAAIGRRIAAEQGAEIVPPYDDPRVIAGQGTVGLEVAEDAVALGLSIDVAVVCASGGGLVAGTATALVERFAGILVYTSEPAGFDDHARSLVAGERLTNAPAEPSFCDALLSPSPGEITFPINRRLLAGGLAVTDAEVEVAMRAAFRHLKLVVEPGGAVALAAILAGKLDVAGKTVAVVLSGGNVDAELFARVITGGP